MQIETVNSLGALTVAVSFFCNHSRINYKRNLSTGISLFVASIKHTGQITGGFSDYFTQTITKVIKATEDGRSRNPKHISNSFAEDPLYSFMRKESRIVGNYKNNTVYPIKLYLKTLLYF